MGRPGWPRNVAINVVIFGELLYGECTVVSRLQIHVPVQTCYRPRGFQEIEAPTFRDNRHMKVVRSVICTDHLYPQEIFRVLISVRG